MKTKQWEQTTLYGGLNNSIYSLLLLQTQKVVKIQFLSWITHVYGWFIFLLQSLNIPFFSINMWFHTKFWYINVSYMMTEVTEPWGLLSVYSVEVNCFALEIFECKKKCMLLESLQPPHQNYTSFPHTQMDKIKLKRQLIFTSPTLNNAKYLILEVKQVMVSLLLLNLDFFCK